MPTRHPLTISLTPELAEFVAAEVRSGLYGSASEVVRAGLRLLAKGAGPGLVLQGGADAAARRAGAHPDRKVVRHG